jgi:hypothetical protein
MAMAAVTGTMSVMVAKTVMAMAAIAVAAMIIEYLGDKDCCQMSANAKPYAKRH